MQNTYVKKLNTNQGFTIVELLIVIVVVAILAAISIVAYTNVQNRTHDSVIKSDLAQFAKKVQLVYVETGKYPVGGGALASEAASNTGNGTVFPNFTFSPSKNSYYNGNNLVYCTSPDVNGNPAFTVRAKSISGTIFEHNSTVGGVTTYATSGDVPQEAGACGALGGWPRSWSYGFYAGTWRAWIN